MSFAIKKKQFSYQNDGSKNKIPLPVTRNSLFESTAKQSTYSSHKFIQNDPILSRFDMIETNLTRVINQHEALLPLLNTQTDLKMLEKQETTISKLKAKLEEDDKALKSLEFELQNFQLNIENNLAKIASTRNEKSIEVLNLEKGMKGTNNLINGLQSNLKDVESTVLNFQRLSDSKFKDLYQNIVTKVDTKTFRNQEDVKKIIKEFENHISNSLKTKMEILNDMFPQAVSIKLKISFYFF